MPNHCETDMYIRGSDEDVTAFAKWLEEIEPLNRDICRALLPYPEHFAKMDEEAAVFSWSSKEDEATRKAAAEAYQAKYGHTKDGYNSGGYEWCHRVWAPSGASTASTSPCTPSAVRCSRSSLLGLRRRPKSFKLCPRSSPI